MNHSGVWRCAFFVLSLCFVSCHRESVRYEEVAKEHIHQEAVLQWALPPSWKEVPAGNLQKARFQVIDKKGEGVEISVASLPRQGSDELANVNRWRRQLQLAPATEEEWSCSRKRLDVGDLQMVLVELEGNTSQMMVAIVPVGSESWFFKIMGPKMGVKNQRELFLTFLKSLSPS